MTQPMTPDIAILADDDIGRPLFWSLVLLVIIILLFGAVTMYRKWMKSDDTGGGEGFTLSDLRRLHKAGQMTDEEFEKAKKIIIGTTKVATDKPVLGTKQRPRTNPPGLDVDSSEK